MVLRRTRSFAQVDLSLFTPSWPLCWQLRWSPQVLSWWSPLFAGLIVSAPQVSFLPLLTSMLMASLIWCAVLFILLWVVWTPDHCLDRTFWCNHPVSVIFPCQTPSPIGQKRSVCPAALHLFCLLIVFAPDCQYQRYLARVIAIKHCLQPWTSL